MPAPRPERADNPLLKLRMILGNGERPMHQVEFAQLVNLPVATLRSLEAGRRVLSRENSLERIEYLIGASFDERDGQWYYLRTKHPYTFSLYKAFSDERSNDPILKAKCLHALVQRTLSLFKAISPQRWLAFFGCVMSKLEDAADEFAIKGRAKLLSETKPQWGLSTLIQDQDGKVYPPGTPPKITTYFRFFNHQNDDSLRVKDAGGLLDFREWREFDSANSAPDSERGSRENT